MSFIEMAVADAKDKEVMPEAEYDLIIDQADIKEKDGRQVGLSIRHSIDGEPDAKAVFHNISFPLPEDDDEKKNNKLLFARGYLKLFNIGYDERGFDLDTFPGARGRCKLTQEIYEGMTSNRIKVII